MSMTQAESETLAEKITERIANCRLVWKETHKSMPKYTGSCEYYSAYNNNSVIKKNGKTPMISVKDIDALSLANALVIRGFKPLIVQPACDTNKGAGVRDGNTQNYEAELCRRTNYWSALKQVSSSNYPLQHGAMIYAKDLTVIKDANYSTLESPFNIGLLSVVLPKRPDTINIGSKTSGTQETYEREKDADNTRKCLNAVSDVARQYDAVIYSNIGVGSTKHPINGFIDLLNVSLKKSASLVYILVPRGEPTGEFKERRRIYKMFKRNVDTMDVKDHSDCESPVEEELPRDVYHGKRGANRRLEGVKDGKYDLGEYADDSSDDDDSSE